MSDLERDDSCALYLLEQIPHILTFKDVRTTNGWERENLALIECHHSLVQRVKILQMFIERDKEKECNEVSMLRHHMKNYYEIHRTNLFGVSTDSVVRSNTKQPILRFCLIGRFWIVASRSIHRLEKYHSYQFHQSARPCRGWHWPEWNIQRIHSRSRSTRIRSFVQYVSSRFSVFVPLDIERSSLAFRWQRIEHCTHRRSPIERIIIFCFSTSSARFLAKRSTNRAFSTLNWLRSFFVIWSVGRISIIRASMIWCFLTAIFTTISILSKWAHRYVASTGVFQSFFHIASTTMATCQR